MTTQTQPTSEQLLQAELVTLKARILDTEDLHKKVSQEFQGFVDYVVTTFNTTAPDMQGLVKELATLASEIAETAEIEIAE